MKLPATEWLSSPARTVQGGVIAILADTAMAIAVQTTDCAGDGLRRARPEGQLPAAGASGRSRADRAGRSLVHAGRTLVITRAEVLNEDDKPVALATGSSMYLPGRPAQLGEVELGAEADEGVDQ